ncbi:topoisomerase I [Verminephrobacter aporrectodeae]|uniref:topoisomerase I n=1 Tax=Verminephrobacter aporrectodeae TaxID=1110389 RepID=UPI0002377B20|nr:topoisomerase I [Verminephrobacter aporrectodeae]
MNPPRLTLNEITAAAVKSALEQPRSIDVKRAATQEARRVLDRLVDCMANPKLRFKVTNHFVVMPFFADAKTEALRRRCAEPWW